MEAFSALLAICAGNLPVPGEFPAHRPVTRSFDVFFELHLNQRLSKQSWGWWFDTLPRPLWRDCNDCINSLLWQLVVFYKTIFFHTPRKYFTETGAIKTGTSEAAQLNMGKKDRINCDTYITNLNQERKNLVNTSITQTQVSGSCCLPLGALQSMWATWCKI